MEHRVILQHYDEEKYPLSIPKGYIYKTTNRLKHLEVNSNQNNEYVCNYFGWLGSRDGPAGVE